MSDRYEKLAAHIENVESFQNTPDIPWELLVGILGDIHEEQKANGAEEDCTIADLVYSRIESLYEADSSAEGFFDRWWKKQEAKPE